MAIIIVLGLATILAQEPTFRASTRLVQVNVIVRERHADVVNLTQHDFSVSDRGKPQTISFFSAQRMGTGAAKLAEPMPANTFSNYQHGQAGTPGSVTIILLDRLNTLRGSTAEAYEEPDQWNDAQALGNAKQQLLKFISEMEPTDRIAIYSLGRSLSALCDFSGDRRELTLVLSKYRATSLTSREEVEPGAVHTPAPGDFNASVDRDRRSLANLANARRTSTTITALLEIAGHVANIAGRKNLVWLTSNLPFSGAEIGRVLSRANIAIYPLDARGLLPRAGPMSQDAPTYAAALMKSPGAASEPAGLSAMREMADETGGVAFINTNDIAGAIRKAVDDVTATYTLGFYPTAPPDGTFHALKVRVNQSGLVVRYPKSYFASKEDPRSDRQTSLQTEMDDPLESTAIPLAVRVENLEAKAPMVRVSGSLGIRNLELAQVGGTRTGGIDIYFVAQDVAGRTLAPAHENLSLHLTNENYTEYLKTGCGPRDA